MKSSEMFEICHRRYAQLRESLKDASGQVRSIALDVPSSGYQWRPEHVRACEFMADFERIGRRALCRREWKGRLRLFETYFVNGVEYRRAINLIGVAEGTFDYWFQQVKRTLGAEFSRTGLFPPSQYFQFCREGTREKDAGAALAIDSRFGPQSAASTGSGRSRAES